MTETEQQFYSPGQGEPETIEFEDLTLAEAVGQLFRAPRSTLQALRQVAAGPRHVTRSGGALVVQPRISRSLAHADPSRRRFVDVDTRLAQQFGLRLAGLLLAWWGSGILANTPQRTEEGALRAGMPFLVLGFLLWLAAELYGDWPAVREWWQRRQSGIEDVEPELVDDDSALQTAPQMWSGLNPVRGIAALSGLFLSLIAVRFTSGNQVTFIGFWAWMVSILLWVIAVVPDDDGPLRWLQNAVAGFRRIRWRSWTVLALAVIVLLGAVFRLSDLANVAPEMTSDHVEKILDSYNVQNGNRSIFFANNGGREPFQMYAMALLSQFPGLGLNFTTLKLLSALEGLVAILLLYWMGREIVGEGDRRLGNLTGLLLAGLVAVSYWHTVLSRMGLRIVLTTAVTAALLVFLARAMRHNRRVDFIKAGLVLGFGLYMYQAVRMLPVVIVVGVGLAFLFNARGWRDRGRYLLNLFTLVLIAFVVFVPMFGYWLEYPQDFWRRTSGRLLGDSVITETHEDGTITQRNATLQERVDAFLGNLPILTNNIRNALLMFNWKGDVAWINGAPNKPTMDMFTGSLLVVGLAAWLARMVRRRDVFDWLLPLALVIMLLPSALSIAYPVENPSHTRTSGALPEAYLIAALPLALMVHSATLFARGRRGIIIGGVLVAVVIVGAYSINSRLYFEDHVKSYIEASYPYSEAGRVLRGFAESDGGLGNAFMMAFPYWWDHRAIGLAAGVPDWPNGVVSTSDLPTFMYDAYERDSMYRFDPEKDILFFLSADDEETLNYLQENFPEGRASVRQSYQHDDMYALYRVPALGEVPFLNWVADG